MTRTMFLLLSTLVIVGCSSKKEAPPAQATPASGTETPDKAGAKPEAEAEPKPKKDPPPLIPAKPLTIAYSDWPGWVAWDIAVQKGWFREAGVNVELKWFEYVPSIDAFSAGSVDAVTMTNGDALVTGAAGTPSKAILINDYSNGNDMVVARPGIESVADLKGKRVGVEVGFVSHLLLINALKSAGLTMKDITVVNVPTDQTPQTLKSGAADAIVAWQPNSGQALKEVPGSKAIFTSANVPGIIYDLLCVSQTSLAQNREAWKRVVAVWFRVADYIADEQNRQDVLAIMSARVGISPAEYEKLLGGTYFLGKEGNLKHFVAGNDLTSVYFSSKTVDAFNVENQVYKQSVEVEPYFDASLVQEVIAESSAK